MTVTALNHYLVREGGLEPPRMNRRILSPVRLPIPPPSHGPGATGEEARRHALCGGRGTIAPKGLSVKWLTCERNPRAARFMRLAGAF